MDHVSPGQASVEALWESFVRAYHEEVHWPPPSKELTVKYVLEHIDYPEKLEPKRREKAAQIFRTCLEQIDRFGSIVAGATSTVFPPSSQCFSAVQMVIAGIKGIYEMFENITTIMERMGAFLRKLRVYVDDQMGKTKAVAGQSARETIFEVLKHFLNVLKKTYKLQNRTSTKVWAGVKMLVFMKDSDIKSDLDRLEVLVSRFVEVEISEIVSGVSYNAQQLDTIGKELQYASAQIDLVATYTSRTQRLAKIREVLGIGKDEGMWHSLTRGKSTGAGDSTCQWLLNHDFFKYWSDPTEHGINLLAVKGRTGTGKSFALDAALRHLSGKSGVKNGQNARVTTVCYTTRNEKLDRRKLVRFLQNVVWQLARSDSAYMDAMYDLCEQRTTLDNAQELWSKCFLELPETLSGTALVIFDGINEVSPDCSGQLRTIFNHLLSSQSQHGSFSIRFLVAGQSQGIVELQALIRSAILKNVPILDMPVIDLDIRRRDHPESTNAVLINHTDIDRHVASKLAYVLAPSGRGSRQGSENRVYDQIKEGLKDLTYENFALIDDYLDQVVQGCVTTQDAPRTLEGVRKRHFQRASGVLKQLNNTLWPAEIEELNHLLSWIVGSRSNKQPLSLTLLNAARMLKTNGKLIGDLRKRILHRYHELLEVVSDDLNSDWVRIQPQFAGYFSSDVEPGSDPNSTGSHKTTQGTEMFVEAGVAQRLLHSIFDDDTYHNKFHFDDYLHGHTDETSLLANQSDTFISFARNQGHVDIVLDCLKATCDYPLKAQYEPLRQYTFEHLMHHVNQLDWDALEEELSEEIVDYLIRWFHDADCIDACWTEGRIAGLQSTEWCLKAEGAAPEVRAGGQTSKPRWHAWIDSAWLLKNSAVSSLVKQNEVAVPFQYALEQEADQKIILFAVMKRLAERWLRTSDFVSSNQSDLFQWLYDYTDNFAVPEDTDALLNLEHYEELQNLKTQDENFQDAVQKVRYRRIWHTISWISWQLSVDFTDFDLVAIASEQFVLGGLYQYAKVLATVVLKHAPTTSFIARIRAALILEIGSEWASTLALLEPVIFEGTDFAHKDPSFRRIYVGVVSRMANDNSRRLKRYTDGVRSARCIWEVCLAHKDCDDILAARTNSVLELMQQTSDGAHGSALLRELAQLGPRESKGVDRLTIIFRSCDSTSISRLLHEKFRSAVGDEASGVSSDYLTKVYDETIKTCLRDKATGEMTTSGNQLVRDLHVQAGKVRKDQKAVTRGQSYVEELRLRYYLALLYMDLKQHSNAIDQLQGLLDSRPPTTCEWTNNNRQEPINIRRSALEALTQIIFFLSRGERFKHQSSLVRRAEILKRCGLHGSVARLYWLGGKPRLATELVRSLMFDVLKQEINASSLLLLTNRLMILDEDDDARMAWRSYYLEMRDELILKAVKSDLTGPNGILGCTACLKDPAAYCCKDCWRQDRTCCESCYASLPAKSDGKDILSCAKDHAFLKIDSGLRAPRKEDPKTSVTDGETSDDELSTELTEWLRGLKKNWHFDAADGVEQAQ